MCRDTLLIALMLLCCAASKNLDAATYTWDGGGGTGVWETGCNWSGGTAPAIGNTCTTDVLIFTGSTQTTTLSDQDYFLAQLRFTGCCDFILDNCNSGDDLILDASSTACGREIIITTAINVEISIDIPSTNTVGLDMEIAAGGCPDIHLRNRSCTIGE